MQGFSLRLPRLEGLDLGAMALDRVGPGLELWPSGSAGPLAVADRWALGPGSIAVAARPAETAVDSARSRFAGQTGQADLGVATLLFADQRGPVTYSINVENGVSDHSGALSDMNTRLSIMGLGVRTGFGRVTLGIRGAESNQRFLDGRRMHRFNQGFLAGAIAGDSVAPVWSLQLQGLDDRLSGNEFANLELKRKGLALAALRHPRPGLPLWARLEAERDWFAIRHAAGVLAPRVERVAGALGVRLPLGTGRWRAIADLRGVWRASDRHSPRAGGSGTLSFSLPRDLELEVGGGRGHVEPTFDQEVLVPGSPVAEPETHDQGMVQLKREGPLAFGVRAVRRNLSHVPQVTGVSEDRPWPEFTFETTETRHWEWGGSVEATFAGLGLVAGADAYRLTEVDSSPGPLPFVPEAVARAHLKWQADLFGGDLVLMPRADLLWTGERADFQQLPIEDHARLDLTLVMVFGRDFDIEFRVRNVTDERYALAVVDPVSGALAIDSGTPRVLHPALALPQLTGARRLRSHLARAAEQIRDVLAPAEGEEWLIGLVILLLLLGALRHRLTPWLAGVAGPPAAVLEEVAAISPERFGRLDINAATADELAGLMRIGPALAARIVADRTARGPFAQSKTSIG